MFDVNGICWFLLSFYNPARKVILYSGADFSAPLEESALFAFLLAASLLSSLIGTSNVFAHILRRLIRRTADSRVLRWSH